MAQVTRCRNLGTIEQEGLTMKHIDFSDEQARIMLALVTSKQQQLKNSPMILMQIQAGLSPTAAKAVEILDELAVLLA